MSTVYRTFQEWAYTNGIVGAAAGWVVGMSTYDIISKIIQDVAMPLLTYLGSLRALRALRATSAVYLWSTVALNVLGSMLVWVITIVATFLVLEYVLSRLVIGIKTELHGDNLYGFEKARLLLKYPALQQSSDDERDRIQDRVITNGGTLL